MKCYFCQNELELDTINPRPSSPHWDAWKSCSHCTSTYNVYEVITGVDTKGNLDFALIRLDEPDNWYDAHQIPPPEMYEPPVKPSFMIRLNLCSNNTDIYYWHLGPTMVLRLPGYPINPANAREKLKLYLLFS
jgi:hypothetical protein